MSTRKNHLWAFLRRLALCGLAAPLILLSPGLVRADVIRTFVVSGTATNITGLVEMPHNLGSCANGATCDFSGMFRVDTTTGMVESSGFDITFPGLTAFEGLGIIQGQGLCCWWFISTLNGPLFQHGTAGLYLYLTTVPTPSSLVGFTGGTIESTLSLVANPQSNTYYYSINGGSITPAPEPSSLVLFASGMLVLGLARRFGKKVSHPLSA